MSTRPKRWRGAACAAAAVCLWGGASARMARAQTPTPAQEPAAPMDRSFTVLLERSIFSKVGRSRAARPLTTAPTSAPYVRPLTPEQANVFRGVLCPDQEYVAFIENIQTGQINVLKGGDEIAGGRIAAITLDTLNFATAGKVHEIRLGQNLAGEAASATTMPTGSSSGSYAGTTTSSPSSPTDPKAAAILEAMRQKRLREGGR
jgi:hypothetical protein